MYEKLFALQEDVLKTIANQKRLEIIQLLEHGNLNVTEMTEMLGIRQANLSQHLSVLRQSGVVVTKRSGHTVTYCLADPRIAEATRLIRTFLQENHKFDADIQHLLKAGSKMYPVTLDPVCGMRVSVSQAAGPITFAEEDYYFCAGGCMEKFKENPEKFVKKEVKHDN